MSTRKPRLSFWQIFNMSFGFLGIQFGFGLQNGNTSRIFQTLGASMDDIPILWVAAPVTGLLIQPIIGYLSDKTWGKWGRRRPYFLIGAILSSIALILMPNSPALWIAAGMLWIMDASINISMEPFRAFVGDMLPNDQRTTGFVMQSFFIGLGAFVSSLLPPLLTWTGVENTAPEGVIPDSVTWSFYIGGIVFLLAVLWTIFSTKEYSPEELTQYEAAEKAAQAQAGQTEGPVLTQKETNYFLMGAIWIVVGIVLTFIVGSQEWKKELFVATVGIAVFGLLQVATGLMKISGQSQNGLVEIIDDLFNMPKTMAQLAVVQFFSWFALFSMWIYSTGAVAEYHYGTTDPTSELYGTGANHVNIMFAAYNLSAALVAFGIPVLARATSRRMAHCLCLIAGGLGLASYLVFKDPEWLYLSMLGVGIAWASILSMPYAILTGALPANKMGVYMGIFNFFIVIPQILAASILGFMVSVLFGGQPIYALLLGGVSMVVAGIITLFVYDPGESLA